MDKKDYKTWIPLYLEGELSAEETKIFEEEMASSSELKQEVEAFRKSWEMLGELEDIEPREDYVSRFWTELAARDTFGGRAKSFLTTVLRPERLAPVLITAYVVIAVSLAVIQGGVFDGPNEQIVNSVHSEDWEIVENLELVENLEILEELDFLEDLEIIEELEALEVS